MTMSGAFPSTPTAALQVLSDVSPLHMFVIYHIGHFPRNSFRMLHWWLWHKFSKALRLIILKYQSFHTSFLSRIYNINWTIFFYPNRCTGTPRNTCRIAWWSRCWAEPTRWRTSAMWCWSPEYQTTQQIAWTEPSTCATNMWTDISRRNLPETVPIVSPIRFRNQNAFHWITRIVT